MRPWLGSRLCATVLCTALLLLPLLPLASATCSLLLLADTDLFNGLRAACGLGSRARTVPEGGQCDLTSQCSVPTSPGRSQTLFMATRIVW